MAKTLVLDMPGLIKWRKNFIDLQIARNANKKK